MSRDWWSTPTPPPGWDSDKTGGDPLYPGEDYSALIRAITPIPPPHCTCGQSDMACRCVANERPVRQGRPDR